jgi:Cu+-exporting ATPase
MLIAAIEQAGYSAQDARPAAGSGPTDDDGSQDYNHLAYLSRRLILALIFFVPLTDASVALSLFPGFRFAGWQWVLDTLVSLGIISACGWSLYAMFVLDTSTRASGRYELFHAAGGGIYLDVAAAVTTFLLAGRFFEARARRSAGEAMRGLAATGARDVCVLAAEH